jgi:hypothetical protein
VPVACGLHALAQRVLALDEHGRVTHPMGGEHGHGEAARMVYIGDKTSSAP